MANNDSTGLSYKDAGVDIQAGADLIKRIAAACKATHRPEMLSTLGGFAAMTEIPSGYQEPVLVSGTDGVGTKLKLAIQFDRHDGVGQDLVAMCANDVLVTGAQPFLFLDYYATGGLEVDIAERVIKGIAAGCELAGCSLAGGETAEMPGFYAPGEYDLAGFCVGVVEKKKIIDGNNVDLGDVILGLPSSGPHSNGYSLIRKVLETLSIEPNESLLDDLLAPTRIYVKSILALLQQDKTPAGEPSSPNSTINAMAHITGGGFYENIPRILNHPDHAALIDLDSWEWPEVFAWMQQAGNIAQTEMLTTFNCGIGFMLVVPANRADTICQSLEALGEQPRKIGRIVANDSVPADGEILVTQPS